MEITPAQWLIAVIGFLGGSAVGAVITHLLTSFRARRQPISYLTRTTTIFAGHTDEKFSAVTKLVVKQADKIFEYDNLHALELIVTNSGNTDFDEFKFGVNLPSHQSTVRVETTPPDRHHSVTLDAAEDTGSPEILPQAMDVTFSPFNRGDRYSLIFQISLQPGGNVEDRISLSTPHPVKFTRTLDRTEISKFAFMGVEIASPEVARFARYLAK